MRFLCTPILVLALVPCIRAEMPHPLRLIPDQANLVLRVDKPRTLIETARALDAVQQAYKLPFIREQLESPAFQRFLNFITYYEQELGAAWPELLDKLAGNGITLAAKVSGEDSPLLLVISGTDPALQQRLLKLATSVIEQELARDESKEKVEKHKYENIEVTKLGPVVAAVAGSDLIISNKPEVMQFALDLHLNRNNRKSLASVAGPTEARKMLPAEALAWLWLDLDVARNAPGAKEAFAIPANDPVQTIALGGWVNVIARSKFLAAALYSDKSSVRVSLRFPGGGYEGSPEALALHVPKKGQRAALPLLEPPGVMLSLSTHFDFKALWELRDKLFNEMIAKSYIDAEKQVAPFLPGTSLGKLFAQVGSNHRFVVAHREPAGYKVKPKDYAPAFAYVTNMRDPKFGQTMNTILRSAALLTGAQVKLKLVEEERGPIKIVGYRFPEKGAFPNDPEDTRFNFSPCFASVHDKFMFASTIEFGREIVDLLQREFERSDLQVTNNPLRLKLYSTGGADALKGFEAQLLGQIILDQAVKPEEGQKQLETLLNWVRGLGQVEFKSQYLDKEYRFDIEWSIGKK